MSLLSNEAISEIGEAILIYDPSVLREYHWSAYPLIALSCLHGTALDEALAVLASIQRDADMRIKHNTVTESDLDQLALDLLDSLEDSLIKEMLK